eukprot:NODE_18_length_40692_cov_0.469183.p10 type:complete len:345 gc:universal NODE_18_length_40692_cov_0.469183:10090-9056(-)
MKYLKDKKQITMFASMRFKTFIGLLLLLSLFLFFIPKEKAPTIIIAESIPVVEEEFSTLIVIPSVTTQVQYHYRKAIRSTWKKTLPSSMKLLFFIGKNNLNSQDSTALQLEASQNNDIVLLDFSEDYHLLSRKMVEIYKYIDSHLELFNGLKWILKTDTDVWINAIRFEQLLNKYQPNKTVIGKIYKNGVVYRKGPWANKDYTSSHYPMYMAGAGYALSFDVVHWLVQQDSEGWLKYMSNEDALLGIWIAGLNVEMVDNDGIKPNIFDHNRKFRRPLPKFCNKESLLIHNLSRRGVLITSETFNKCNSPCLDDCPTDIKKELSKYLSGPEMFQKIMHDKLNIDV